MKFFSDFFAFVVYFCVLFDRRIYGETDYCKIPSCPEGTHTLCLHSSDTPSSACVNYDPKGKLTGNEDEAILKKHNDLRQKIAQGSESRGNPGPQPPASNMRIMQWDSELAKIAQRHADQCVFTHDQCRDVEQSYVGQNIAMGCNSKDRHQSDESFIQLWYDEVALFNKEYVSRYQFAESWGHYSQLAWANTSRIGCGRSAYVNSFGLNCILFVCNYQIGGNIVGESMYQIGPAASACPSGVSSKSTLLCN